MSILDVHLHGERIGTLFLAGEDDYRFAYDPDLAERSEPGIPLLSAALPLRPEPFGAEPSRAFVEGLLPEGGRRARIAAALEIEPTDGFGLIAVIGSECPGAVSFRPRGEGEPEAPEEFGWLTEAELEALLAPHRGLRPHAPEAATRAALAGEHDKLALVHDPERGRWGLPGPGRPSTHVIKPESGEYPGLAANEAFCQTLAERAGLPAAAARYELICGRPCLVSPRFDRTADGGRIHQEDFCQALGFPPPADIAAGRASEEDAEGPGFAEACGLLGALGARDELPTLLAAAVFNYTVGNGDAHGKNFALLYADGGASLAPLHDLTSTAVYDLPTYTGMVLAEDYDETAYLYELNLIAEECGIELNVFRDLAAEVAARIGEALGPLAAQVRAEGWHQPVIDEIVALTSVRARCLGYEVEY
jgi:serine/threonine-protein kinase HipA